MKRLTIIQWVIVVLFLASSIGAAFAGPTEPFLYAILLARIKGTKVVGGWYILKIPGGEISYSEEGEMVFIKQKGASGGYELTLSSMWFNSLDSYAVYYITRRNASGEEQRESLDPQEATSIADYILESKGLKQMARRILLERSRIE